MITIYKYKVDPYTPGIKMPKGAELLSAAFQGEDFFIWAKVDTEAEIETRNFHAFGTGHEIPGGMGVDYKFIGTGHMYNGLVFHAFERSVRACPVCFQRLGL